jgi:DNA-binding beta-propeller fold protein YncE
MLVPHARAGVIAYASNFGSNTITAYDAATGAFLGTPVTAGPELSGLNGMRLSPAGAFLVAGQLSNSIVEYGPGGSLLRVFDPANTAGLNSPQDLAIGPDGNLYVVSSGNDKILKYDLATGASLGEFADLGASGHLGPIGLAFGPDSNLYVTSFDDARVVRVHGLTGAVLSSTPGPPRFGFGPAVFGPTGDLYIVAIDLLTFGGRVYRYNTSTDALDLFIPEGSGGLISTGGLAFDPAGNLLVSNILADESFNDIGSTILRYDGATGAPMGTVVPAGQGLNIPFFLTVVAIPEPSTTALLLAGLVAITASANRRKSART